MVINLADQKEKKMETEVDCGESLEITIFHLAVPRNRKN